MSKNRGDHQPACVAPQGLKATARTAAADAVNAATAVEAQEIGDREQALVALRASEERLRLAAEATGFGTYDCYPLTGSLVWSDQLYAIAGLPTTTAASEELFINSLHPDDRKKHARALERALDPATGGRHELEVRIVRPDGETRWVRDTGRTYFAGQGDARRAVRVIGTVQDITERKRVEMQLRRLSRVFQEAADPIMIEDMQGCIIDMNDEAVRAYGWSRDELIGQPIKTLVPLERHARHKELLARCKQHEPVRNVEDLRVTKDRRLHPVLITLTLLTDEQQQPIGVVTLTKNISRLKWTEAELNALNESLEMQVATQVGKLRRAEEDQARLAALVESSSAAIISMNNDRTIAHWNTAAERLFGYRADEAVGRSVRILVPPDRQTEQDAIIAQVVRGEAVQDFETVRLHRDGTRIDVALTISPIGGNGGAVKALSAIVRDLRQQKRLEQAFAEAADSVRQSVGHDLHDSLGQQITATGMLSMSLANKLRGGSSPYSDDIEQINANIENAKTTVRRLTKGLLPVAVEAHGLCVALEELAEETYEAHGVACTFEQVEEPLVEDNFTATQLYLIAREAIHNAVKHAQANEISVHLAAREGITLVVHDDGIGLPAVTPDFGGMGLRIMRHRANLVGAALTIDVAEARGTIVRIILAGGTEKMRRREE